MSPLQFVIGCQKRVAEGITLSVYPVARWSKIQVGMLIVYGRVSGSLEEDPPDMCTVRRWKFDQAVEIVK